MYNYKRHMMQELSNKNRNPGIQVAIAGIGYLSPHGEDLKEIARAELTFIYEHLKSYSQNEQIFILDFMTGEIIDKTLELENEL